jgi:hemerythrin-like metal-binding protein
MAEAGDETLAWHDGFLLGYGPMDGVHQEFVQCVSALQVATDADLPAALDALEAHVLAHFGEEDRWMEESGFPARECHVNEHAAVLASLRGVKQRLAQGDAAVCRRLALELARWFPGHADYLDSALAHWMCKQRLGGKPVVVRRDMGWRRAIGHDASGQDR